MNPEATWLLETARRFAGHFSRDPHDREDYAGDAVLKALKSLGGNPGASQSWLKTVLWNAMIDRARRPRSPFTGLDCAHVCEIEDALLNRLQLGYALDHLHPNDAAILQVANDYGWDLQAISKEIGMKGATFRNQVALARHRAQRWLEAA